MDLKKAKIISKEDIQKKIDLDNDKEYIIDNDCACETDSQ